MIFAVVITLLIVIFTYGMGNVSAASGDTVFVNGSSGNDASDGSSWLLAKKSIQNATGTVNENGMINIADGLYTGNDYDGISITKNMTINGQSKEGTILNGTGSYRIFQIQNGINFSITNLTLINASAYQGGAIYNEGTVTITDCDLTSNTANYGGAIWSSGNVTITDSNLISNTGYQGGAIYNNDGNLTITDCDLTSNTADYGGAIYSNYLGNVSVTNCTFTSNYAQMYGGSINNNGILTVNNVSFISNTAQYYCGGIYNRGSVVINDCIFTSNIANDGVGGAIYNDDGTITIDNSTFTSNTGNNGGGAICNTFGTITVNNSTFTRNTAYQGAAIYNYSGTLNVTNCNLTSNSAGSGGAIYNEDGTMTIDNSTFTSNTATSGGAIYNKGYNLGTLNVLDSTFTSNIANAGGAFYQDHGTLNVSFCRIVGNTPYDIVSSMSSCNVDYNWWGSNFVGSDPVTAGRVSGASVSKWLVLTITADEDTIKTGETSTITADLLHDQNGVYQNPNSGHVPDGIPVNFTTTFGTINNHVSTVNGAAISTLESNNLSGVADVSATIDNQIVHTSITIDNIPPTGSATPTGGLYNTTKIVILNMNEAGTIYYTTDGTIPNISSSKYMTPISITSTKTLKYFAIDLAGNLSPIYTKTYTIDKIAPTAKANIKGGLYNANKIVSLSMNEKGTIYYTLTGNTPTTSSTKYTRPITISSTKILKYLAVDLAGNKSPVYTQIYKIDKIVPKIATINPTNRKTGVSRASTIIIKFSEIVKNSTYYNKITIKNLKTGKYVRLTKTLSGRYLSIKTSYRSKYTWYQITIPRAAIKDYAGNNLITTYTFKFKTRT